MIVGSVTMARAIATRCDRPARRGRLCTAEMAIELASPSPGIAHPLPTAADLRRKNSARRMALSLSSSISLSVSIAKSIFRLTFESLAMAHLEAGGRLLEELAELKAASAAVRGEK
jgi:hypothetical protein